MKIKRLKEILNSIPDDVEAGVAGKGSVPSLLNESDIQYDVDLELLSFELNELSADLLSDSWNRGYEAGKKAHDPHVITCEDAGIAYRSGFHESSARHFVDYYVKQAVYTKQNSATVTLWPTESMVTQWDSVLRKLQEDGFTVQVLSDPDALVKTIKVSGWGFQHSK